MNKKNISFKVLKECGSARLGKIFTPRGEIDTPTFMTVGTQATVKSAFIEDVILSGAQIILSNTYHLMIRPGVERIKRVGGLHEFMNCKLPILTDSGGFQIMSLSKLVKIDKKKGAIFNSHLDGKKFTLSPEESIKIQKEINSDILMVLDECPKLSLDKNKIHDSLKLSLNWAERSKFAFGASSGKALFGIVQGGIYKDLRLESLEGLKKIEFDGYALGGLAVGETQEQMFKVLTEVIPSMPFKKPRYLMGVGTPSDILGAVKRGVDMFDCVMPTRNGRNGQIFTSSGTININNEKYKNDHSLIDESSENAFGRMFTKSYLRHLFNVKEILGLRIASTLNLSYYFSLMKMIQKTINSGDFEKWSSGWLSEMKTKKGM